IRRPLFFDERRLCPDLPSRFHSEVGNHLRALPLLCPQRRGPRATNSILRRLCTTVPIVERRRGGWSLATAKARRLCYRLLVGCTLTDRRKAHNLCYRGVVSCRGWACRPWRVLRLFRE